VACALIDGAVRIDHFAPEALERADLRALAGRVTCLADPEIERRWGRSISPAQLVVETPTGTLEAWVEFPKGHPRAPMSEADFQAKALDCLSAGGAVDPETGARVLAGAVADLPARQGVAALIGAMIAPARP
ncbi:MAG: MmgE/PrpD family protein, partial [Rhodospirillum sp.]|nr:MmgE/PrpD family protein [Rhodospirillum sp.]